MMVGSGYPRGKKMYSDEGVIPDSQSESSSPNILRNLRMFEEYSHSPTISCISPRKVISTQDKEYTQGIDTDDAGNVADSDETVLSLTAQNVCELRDTEDQPPQSQIEHIFYSSGTPNYAGTHFQSTAVSPNESAKSFKKPAPSAPGYNSDSIVPAIHQRKPGRRRKTKKRKYNVINSQQTQALVQDEPDFTSLSDEDDLDDSKREEEISFRFSQVSGRDFANEDDRKHERAIGVLNRIEAEQVSLRTALQKPELSATEDIQKQLIDLDESIRVMATVYRYEKDELSRSSCASDGLTSREQKRLLRDRQILHCRRQKRLDDIIKIQKDLRSLVAALFPGAIRNGQGLPGLDGTGGTNDKRTTVEAHCNTDLPSGLAKPESTQRDASPISQLRQRYGLSPPFARTASRSCAMPVESNVASGTGWLHRSMNKKKATLKWNKTSSRGRKSLLTMQRNNELRVETLATTHSKTLLQRATLPAIVSQKECGLCGPFEQLDLQTQTPCADPGQRNECALGAGAVHLSSDDGRNYPVVDASTYRCRSDEKETSPGTLREREISDLLSSARTVLIDDSEIDTSKQMETLFQHLGNRKVSDEFLLRLFNMSQ